LQRVIHTAVAITEGEVIPPEAILLETSLEAVQAGDSNGADHPEPTSGVASASVSDLSLRAAELRHIHAVLDSYHGNKRRAARALGLSRSTLDRKLHGE
ncbi:MAG TPA: helix-turn-helix domain-containing protein, partial [Gemmatimonadales bacterium]|nr:helix-turn-helix domain-containing protein [Gemmatimonadales bacterium]